MATKLVQDTRRVQTAVQKALDLLFTVETKHDDPDLAWAAGKLADGIMALNKAANKFERRGTGYGRGN